MEQQANMLRNQIRSDPTALQDLRRVSQGEPVCQPPRTNDVLVEAS